MARSKTAAQRLNAAERVAKIWELRKSGLAYDQIAKRLGVSKGTVSKDLTKALGELLANNVEGAEEVRALELERLDVALAAIWPKVKKGLLGAVDRLVSIQARRAKLLGLDAPTRSEVTGKDGEALIPELSPEQRQARLAELLEKRAAGA